MARSSTITLPLRWRDIDALGHINQAVYHEFLEEGRGALFMPLIEASGGFEFVLARVELDYRHEVRLADRAVDVITRVERIGRTSVTVANEIRAGDRLAAEGQSILVAWDGAGRRARELTAAEREVLEG